MPDEGRGGCPGTNGGAGPANDGGPDWQRELGAALLGKGFPAVIIYDVVRDREGRPVDYTVVKVNPTAEALARRTASSMEGRRLSELTTPSAPAEEVFGNYALVVTTGQPARFEYHVRGIDRHIEIVAVPMPGDRLAALFHDVSERVNLLQELRRARDATERYLDVAQVMLLVLDPQGRIALINRKGCEILGYGHDELIGRDWFGTALPPALRGVARGVFDGIIAGEEAPLEYYENPVVTDAGEERMMAWHNTVVRDADGRLEALLSSGMDITERRRAEAAVREAHEDLHALFEHSVSGIIIFDVERGAGGEPVDYDVREANSAAATIIGIPREAFLGRTAGELGGGKEDVDLFKKNIDVALATGASRRFEYSSEGFGRDLDINVIPLASDCAAIAFYDLTDHRRAGAELVEERNRAELYMDLMGHDITNLNQGTLTNLELLLLKEGLPEGSGRYISNAIGQSMRISELLANVRRLSRLRRGPIERTVVDAHEELQAARSRLQEQHRGRRIEMRDPCAPGDVLVHCTDMLDVVFDSILSNAAKFDRTDPLVLEVTCAPTADATAWRFEFRDHGPGIPDALKQLVFNRLDGSSGTLTGRGLGLTIAQQIVRASGGRVWAEDRVPGDPSQGACIVVELPMARPPSDGRAG